MTADLRELLREARPKLAHIAQLEWATQDLVYRIDAALAEPAPEPVAWLLTWDKEGRDVCRVVYGKCVQDADTSAGQFAHPFYAALPPASPDDARDAARYRAWRHLVIVRATAPESSYAWFHINAQDAASFDAAMDAAIEREGGAK